MRELTNNQYEQALLSGIKHDPSLLDAYPITEDLFETGRYRAVFRTIRNLYENGNPKPDDVMLAKRADVSLDILIQELDLPTSSNAEFYVTELRKLYELRRLRRMGQWVQDSIEQGKDSDEILETVDKGITRIDEEGGKLRTLSDFLHPAIEEVEYSAKHPGKIAGVPSGFDELDVAFNGFQGGLLYVLAARPSIGKTALAMTFALKQAAWAYPVGFFSCEMSGPQLAKRVMSSKGRVNMIHMLAGRIHGSDFDDMISAANDAARLEILIDDTPNPKLTHIKAKARQMKRSGSKIIYVDYLTLIRYGVESMSAPERYGQISKQLKGLARELDLPIVVLSQLNRDAEGQMPGLHNLRQSGQVEEDADAVMFLHRDRSSYSTDLLVAKNRQGPLAHLNLTFRPEYVTFEEGIETDDSKIVE